MSNAMGAAQNQSRTTSREKWASKLKANPRNSRIATEQRQHDAEWVELFQQCERRRVDVADTNACLAR